MTINVFGGEQLNDGNWDQGSITLTLNGYSKTVLYGRMSTPYTVASTLEAAFGGNCDSPFNVTVNNNYTFTITPKENNPLVEAAVTYQWALEPLGVPSFTLNLPKITPSLAISCTPGLATVASPEQCNIQMPASPQPTQQVMISIDGGGPIAAANIGVDGTATASIMLPTAGYHSITASYAGDNNYFSVTGSTEILAQYSGSGEASASALYSFDIVQSDNQTTGFSANGNVAAFYDSINGQWTAQYDGVNRLISSSSWLPGPGSSITYSCLLYDSFGNRQNQVISTQPFQPGLGCSSSGITSAFPVQFDVQNHFTGTPLPQYDAAGNITEDNRNNYLYDGQGNVCAVGYPLQTGGIAMYQYIYNTDGKRVAKGIIQTWSCDITLNGFQAIESYGLDEAGEVITEMAGPSGSRLIWKRTDAYAGGTLLATYDAKGMHFEVADWLGSKRLQADVLGSVEETCSNGAFGDALICTFADGSLTAEDASPVHFTGKERDTESGLDYFGARYYASSMGRWMSPDWAAKAEPVPYAKLDNPQSLNLYGYVGNNPLSRADADGHQQEEDAEGEAELAMARNARNGLRPITPEEAMRLGWPVSQITLTPEEMAFRNKVLSGAGGRWGSPSTRNLNVSIADLYRGAGYEVLGGAYNKEEWLPGPNGGTKGGTFVDLTVSDGKQITRIQTVDVDAKGNLTPAEAAAAARIRAKYPSDVLRLIPKTAPRRPASSDPVVTVKVK